MYKKYIINKVCIKNYVLKNYIHAHILGGARQGKVSKTYPYSITSLGWAKLILNKVLQDKSNETRMIKLLLNTTLNKKDIQMFQPSK